MREALGLLGRKVGMTRIFTDDGESVPGNSARRVEQSCCASADARSRRLFCIADCARCAPLLPSHQATSGAFCEGRDRSGFVAKGISAWRETGRRVQGRLYDRHRCFSVGQKVDVTGVTIGKGFAGAIKRHHFSSNRATHGNSVSTNAPGSIGMRQDPGRVMPGKRMAGHLGDKQRTTQNLVVARIDTERQLLLIRGAVPGAAGGKVVVRPAAKAKAVKA